jgi:hypothetical protein
MFTTYFLITIYKHKYLYLGLKLKSIKCDKIIWFIHPDIYWYVRTPSEDDQAWSKHVRVNKSNYFITLDWF